MYNILKNRMLILSLPQVEVINCNEGEAGGSPWRLD
jgi:hypothetical protein